MNKKRANDEVMLVRVSTQVKGKKKTKEGKKRERKREEHVETMREKEDVEIEKEKTREMLQKNLQLNKQEVGDPNKGKSILKQ